MGGYSDGGCLPAEPFMLPIPPLIPTAFAVVSLAIAFNQIRVDPSNSIIGLLMVLIGLPIYWLWGSGDSSGPGVRRRAH